MRISAGRERKLDDIEWKGGAPGLQYYVECEHEQRGL